MYQLKNIRTPAGWVMMGMLDVNIDSAYIVCLLRLIVLFLQALTGLTNGVLRDERVFYIDKSDWIAKYNDQGYHPFVTDCYLVILLIYIISIVVQFEVQKTNAWVDVGPEVVIKEAQERLSRQGWDVLRPALSVTVRVWIMRGFIEGGIREAPSFALEFLGNALEVLDWGRQAWKNVSNEVRGTIFKSTFIRGVRSLHIRALMEVCFCCSPSLKEDVTLKGRVMIIILD
jgi:hypothetical protein